MELKLLSIGAVLLASCIVMILHEIPKTAVFFSLERRNHLGKQLLKSHQFIDPVGLIFSLTGFCGFSKSYMLRSKRTKDNIILGVVGYVTLILVSIVALLICKFGFGSVDNISNGKLFLFMVVQYSSIISFGMLITNLFPLMTMDMGLIIAGISREKYFSIIRNDYFIKMIFILCALLGIIRTFCVNEFLFLYQL
ncbi:MAG: hypothetical protein ACERKN_05270 [Velocimicrobium sp.]